MNPRLEHGNLTVRDLDEIVRFVRTAFPTFQVRREGEGMGGGRWLHVGDDDHYLALTQATDATAAPREPYDGSIGLNHLGWVVDDVDALRTRLRDAGYRESTFPNAHPHRKRVYFLDPEGNDWEFVQYFSDDPRERNDYELDG